MAASFRSAGAWSFTANNVANPSTLTPGAPSGKAVGDFLILIAESRSNSATVSTPTGWNIVSGFPVRSGTASGGTIYVWTRIADGTANDTPSPVWSGLTTGTSGDASGAGILAYTGMLEILDGTVQSSDLSAQGATSVIPAFTTANNNSMVIGIAMKLLESSGQTATVATFTERADNSTTTGTGHIVVVAEKLQATAGSSGTSTVTWSATGSARALTCSLGIRESAHISVSPGTGVLSAAGFAPTAKVSVFATPGTGQLLATGKAPIFGVPSNFAIEIPAAESASGTSTVTQRSNIGLTARVKGSAFTNVTTTGYLFQIGDMLVMIQADSTNYYIYVAKASTLGFLVAGGPFPVSEIDSAAYYRLRIFCDQTASPKQAFVIYDDAGTLVRSSTASDATVLDATNQAIELHNYPGHSPIGAGITADWFGIWNGAPPAGAPADLTGGESGLLALFPCNENGSPDALVDSISGTTQLTFSGTHSWVALGGGGGSPVSVTPGLGVLSATGLAPTWVNGIQVAPGVGTLSATGFAPVANSSCSALPGTGVVSASGFAPTANVSIFATPGTGVLAATGLAPTANVAIFVTPGVGVLSATGFGPTANVSVFATPGTGLLVASGFSPTVVTPNSVSPGTATLAASGFAPSADVGNNQAVSPGAGSLDASGLAPSVAVTDNQAVSPGAGVLAADGFEPSIAITDNKSVAPGVGQLDATGFAPTMTLNIAVAPGVGQLAVAGLSPTVNITQSVSTGTGLLVAAGYAPSADVSNNIAVATDLGELVAAGYVPTMTLSDNKFVLPGTGQLVAAGFEPTPTSAPASGEDAGLSDSGQFYPSDGFY